MPSPRSRASRPPKRAGGFARPSKAHSRPPGSTGSRLAGLGNEYLSYFATPEEYDRQHYEGGFTLYGRTASVLVTERLTGLAQALATGSPAPAAQPFDSTNGLRPDAEPFPKGADRGTITMQPKDVDRLARVKLAWDGGPAGEDRPLDASFVSIQRRTRGGRYRTQANDLGLQIAWTTDIDGHYVAVWEVPLDAPVGTYRIVVSANGYRLTSTPFTVAVSRGLGVEQVSGDRALRLTYPDAETNVDFTYRPHVARGGTVRFRRSGRSETVRARGGRELPIPGAGPVVIPAGGARDRHGNTNAEEIRLR